MKKILLALCAFWISTSASGQDFSLPPMMGSDLAVGLAAQSHIQKSEERRAQSNNAAVNADFSFSSDRGRTQQNLQAFVIRTPNAQAKAELQTLIAAQPDIIELIWGAIGPYGLDSHDVADAYTVWWINAWLASQMRDEDVDRGTVQAVRAQARAALAGAADFSQTGDAERQIYAEALLLQATILDAAVSQAANDPATLRAIASAASQGAINTGIDLSTMTLTPDGFVSR